MINRGEGGEFVIVIYLFIFFYLLHIILIAGGDNKGKRVKDRHETRKVASALLYSRLITRAHVVVRPFICIQDILSPLNECRARVCL